MSIEDYPTPLTDAAIIKADGSWSFELRDLARDLERKLRQAEEKLDKDAPSLSETERVRRQRELSDQGLQLQRKLTNLQW